MAVIEIGGLPKVARTLGISETTVKTHLHRVFAKTGTDRQADLVRPNFNTMADERFHLQMVTGTRAVLSTTFLVAGPHRQ